MSDLVSRLLAAIDETERLAREAIDPERPGTHWHWVTNETDTPVAAGELAEAQNHQSISLRTIEEFETRSVGILPAFLLYGQDVNPGAGEHIVRNDPAAVLRRCAADRKLLARGGPFCSCYEYGPPTNPNTGLSIPHHYDCSSYEAASLLAEVYGISVEEEA